MARSMMRAAVVTMVGLALAGGALGQVQGGEKQPATAARAQASGYTITVGFPGGTVAEYVVALKQACKPHPVNVVLSGGAGKQELAEISLQGASLAAAMQAIPAASTSGLDAWRIKRLPDAMQGEDAPSDNKDAAPVYQVSFAVTGRDPFRPPLGMEVFSLRGVVEGAANEKAAEERISSALKAVETALQMDPHHTTMPEIKFHKESGLLIVRGEQEDVAAVREIIARMSDDAGQAADETARRETARKVNEINVMRAQVNVKSAQDRLALAASKLKELEQLYASGGVPSGEVRQAKMEAAEREADVQRAELDLQAAHAAVQGGVAGRGGKDWRAPSREAGEKNEMDELRKENAALKDKIQDMSKRIKDLEAAMAAGRANNAGKK